MKIEYASEKYLDSFWSALDEVSKERVYLLSLKAPEILSTKSFVKEIIKSGWTQFFAIENDTVVGWCDILPMQRKGLTHVGHVGMGVTQKYRGKGIGKQLLLKSLEHAFETGLQRIELEVFSSNNKAISLYKKYGFKIEGVKSKARYLDGKYDDITIMARLKNFGQTKGPLLDSGEK